MKKPYLLITIIFMFALSCLLGACGKVSKPEPYPGSGYPHSYPRR